MHAKHIPRQLQGLVLELLGAFPCVALLGPRQCGKTTLAHSVQAEWSGRCRYLDLESPNDLQKLEDPEGYLAPLASELVILDEIQQRSDLFPSLRGLIDKGCREGRARGRFLFLGSASYELLQQSGESLAGRIAYLELTPFRLLELGEASRDTLWYRGGFPKSLLAMSDEHSRLWCKNFIDTYLSKDLAQHKALSTLPSMRRFLQMLAHLHGQVLNVGRLVKASDLSRSQVVEYLNLFEHSFVLRRLQPYFTNMGKRLVRRPKIYFRDTGLLHYLLAVPDLDTLLGHSIKGFSWEAFVIEQICFLLPDWQPHFYCTSHGAEIDLLMLKGQQSLAFDIKYSASAKVEKAFYMACRDVKPTQAFAVSNTRESFMGAHNLQRLGLEHLPQALRPFCLLRCKN